jgi:hypothetical protein
MRWLARRQHRRLATLPEMAMVQLEKIAVVEVKG